MRYGHIVRGSGLVSICARSGRSGLFGVLQRFGAAGGGVNKIQHRLEIGIVAGLNNLPAQPFDFTGDIGMENVVILRPAQPFQQKVVLSSDTARLFRLPARIRNSPCGSVIRIGLRRRAGSLRDLCCFPPPSLHLSPDAEGDVGTEAESSSIADSFFAGVGSPRRSASRAWLRPDRCPLLQMYA